MVELNINSSKRKHRTGYGRQRPVCVEKRDGTHVRVDHKTASELVAAGGRYLAKWEYNGKINRDGESVTADWSHKKTSEECAKRREEVTAASEKKQSKKKNKKSKKENN
jgi:hypothetical protein